MKVIFIADVPNVARVGQTREVADGYARNYLFPRKLAVLADSQAAAAIEAHLKKLVKQRTLEEAEMSELAKKISGVEITLKAKVGENEKLYGSITGADIAEALSKAAGCEIDKKKIDLAEPIKQVGTCDVTVRLAHEITAVIKVNVISEEAPPEEKKEKVEKKEKKEKKEKPPKEAEEEKPAEAAKEAKPPKEEKAKKAEKAEKEEKPAAEGKKEKKPRAKTKKTEESLEAKKES